MAKTSRKSENIKDRQSLLAMGTIIGTAIGAGTFGLPYIASKAGFVPVVVMLLVLGIFTIYSNLMYGEVTLRTRKKCRLTGYAYKYLGIWGKRSVAAVSFFSLYSSVLLYMILGGSFLNLLLSGFLGGDGFMYSIAIFVFVSLAAYFNLNLFSVVESYLVLFMLFAMSAIMLRSAPHIDVSNFMTVDPAYFFLPFGAILFSLSASMAIPEFEHIMNKSKERMKKTILWGTISYIFIYMFFIVAILGVTGAQTSEESFAGLSLFIGDGVITLGLIFGLLAVITSYLMTATSIKEIFMYDYKIDEKLSWFLSCSIPFAVFVAGMRNFIQVLSIAGSVMGGFIGILIILIFYRAKEKGDVKPAYSIKVPEAVSALMIFVYLLGIIYQFIYKNW